jgi:hypothetical protein
VTREPDPTDPVDADPEDAEVVDGLPVLAPDLDEQPAAEPPRAPAPAVVPENRLAAFVPVPARQVAALAASGFVAGAATVAMVHRRRSRAPARRARRRKAATRTPLGEVVSSSSFLVDVHLLRRD